MKTPKTISEAAKVIADRNAKTASKRNDEYHHTPEVVISDVDEQLSCEADAIYTDIHKTTAGFSGEVERIEGLLSVGSPRWAAYLRTMVAELSNQVERLIAIQGA